MWTTVPLEFIVVLIISLITFVLPILLVIWFIRSLIRNKRENQRLRLEVGKLADELQQIRKKTKDKQSGDSY
jgi:hypothetical protein